MSTVLQDLLHCPVRTFTKPVEALAALPDLDLGIIVIDYYMPLMDGLSFLRHAAKLKPDIPFVMITGHSEALEATDYSDIKQLKTVLAKPFGGKVLADTILKYWPEAGGIA